MDLRDHAEEYAKEFENNWRDGSPTGFQFDQLSGFEAPGPGTWGVFYTGNRDSNSEPLIASNAHSIKEMLEPFTKGEDPDVVERRDGHWGFGYFDGYAVRVRREEGGDFTEAFLKLTEIGLALSEYPVLDDDDYSERENDLALETIRDLIWPVIVNCDPEPDYDADELSDQINRWLWDNTDCANHPEWSQKDVSDALHAMHPEWFEEDDEE